MHPISFPFQYLFDYGGWLLTRLFALSRRYVILMKTHMLTYKENDGNWQAATEVIPINNCCTVKSADDELNV